MFTARNSSTPSSRDVMIKNIKLIKKVPSFAVDLSLQLLLMWFWVRSTLRISCEVLKNCTFYVLMIFQGWPSVSSYLKYYRLSYKCQLLTVCFGKVLGLKVEMLCLWIGNILFLDRTPWDLIVNYLCRSTYGFNFIFCTIKLGKTCFISYRYDSQRRWGYIGDWTLRMFAKKSVSEHMQFCPWRPILVEGFKFKLKYNLQQLPASVSRMQFNNFVRGESGKVGGTPNLRQVI